MAILSNRIRECRRAAGLSQSEIARQLGVERSSIAHWERLGGSRPSTANMAALACATSVGFEWIATGRGPMRLDASPIEGLDPLIRIARDDAEEHLLNFYRALRPAARSSLLVLVQELGETHSSPLSVRNRKRPTVARPRRRSEEK